MSCRWHLGEHAQALIDELFASQRFALAIEQNRITFDLGQRKDGEETLNRPGVAELSTVSMWQETAAMRDVSPAYVGSGS
jgi:hypothetical protein